VFRTSIWSLVGNTILSAFGIFAVTSTHIAHAQLAASTPDLSVFVFEVTSIHPDPPGSMGGTVRVMFEPSRFEATHVTAKELLREAYGVEDLQIQRDPRWMDSDSFTVDATINSVTSEALAKLSGQDLAVARQHMLRALLVDHFHLVVKEETNELPIYALIIGKDRPKLREANSEETYENGARSPNGDLIGPHVVYYQFIAGAIQMKGQGVSIDQLVDRLNQKLSRQLGRKFVNGTGLPGIYNFDLDFRVPWQTSFGPMANSTPLDDDGAGISSSDFSLVSSIQEQLGLKLKSTKGAVPILSVDHLEQPSPN
jgi:uncharacterized protein (TIGR03435 family)